MKTIAVLEESSCPNCGDDLFAKIDVDGGTFDDGDAAWCASCGLTGQVTCDEGGAYFSEVEESNSAISDISTRPAATVPR